MLLLKELIYIFSLFLFFYFFYRTILNKISKNLVNRYSVHLTLMSISILFLSTFVNNYLFYKLELRVDFIISSYLPLLIINNIIFIVFVMKLLVLLIFDAFKKHKGMK